MESLDRISRQKPIDALALWLQILQTGVSIHTLNPRRRYSADSDQLAVFEAVIILSRANEESEIKSHRISQAWKQKRANASTQKLTRNCPAWLRLSEDRTHFEVIKSRAKTVQGIFRLCIEGRGSSAIARKLNQEQVPLIGGKSNSRTWYDSYIKKILHSRAVIGEYQPTISPKDGKPLPEGDPIPDYYPRIIADAVFYKAQKLVAERDHKRGPIGKQCTNLFQSLLKDEQGETLYLLHRGSGRISIASSAALRGEKTIISFPYDQFEGFLLNFLYELPSHELFAIAPDTSTIQKSINDEEARLAASKQQLARLQGKLLIYEDVDALLDTIRQLEAAIRESKAKAETLRHELHTATQVTSATDLRHLFTALRTVKGDDLYSLRLKMREAIRAIIDHITVRLVSHSRYTREANCEIHFKAGGLRRVTVCCNSRNGAAWALSPSDAGTPPLSAEDQESMDKQGFVLRSER